MKTSYNYEYEENELLKKEYDVRKELIRSIEKLQKALEIAYSNFNFVTEPDLVDSYIYELNSIQAKYQYLINQAKELGIISEKYEYKYKKDK